MATYRLKSGEVLQKLDQVFSLMDELGIKIEVSDSVLVVCHNGKEYRMLDNEVPSDAYHSGVDVLPPACEYKLVFEKDE